MQSLVIPDKLYFKIGEVANLTGLKPFVLRYWETEFPDIAPVKSRTNQRLYKRKDVELIGRIKELLYQERFTIEGARKRLKEESRRKDRTSQLNLPLQLNFADLKVNLTNLVSEMERNLER